MTAHFSYFNDSRALADALDVPIITASQMGVEMGRRRAEVLMARVENPHRPVEKCYLKADLTVPQVLSA